MIHANYLGYCNIISKYRYLIQRLGNQVLKHTCKEQNKVAHALAKSRGGEPRFNHMQILIDLPLSVNGILEADKLETSYPRKVVACHISSVIDAIDYQILRDHPSPQNLFCKNYI